MARNQPPKQKKNIINPNLPTPLVLAMPSVGYCNAINGREFTKNGSPYIEYIEGDEAYRLDGSNYLSLQAEDLELRGYTNTFTVLLQFETKTSNYTNLYITNDGASNGQKEFSVNGNGAFAFFHSGIIAVLYTANSFISQNTIYTAVIVFNHITGNGSLYIDGQLIQTVTGATYGWGADSAPTLGRFRSTDILNTADHRTYLFAKWAGLLQEEQAKELSLNPFSTLFFNSDAITKMIAINNDTGGGGGGGISSGFIRRRRRI